MLKEFLFHRLAVANEVVKPVHVETTMNQFAELLVGGARPGEQTPDLLGPVLSENVL